MQNMIMNEKTIKEALRRGERATLECKRAKAEVAIRDRIANFRMDYLDMSHLVGDERYHDRLTHNGL